MLEDMEGVMSKMFDFGKVRRRSIAIPLSKHSIEKICGCSWRDAGTPITFYYNHYLIPRYCLLRAILDSILHFWSLKLLYYNSFLRLTVNLIVISGILCIYCVIFVLLMFICCVIFIWTTAVWSNKRIELIFEPAQRANKQKDENYIHSKIRTP